MQNVKLGLFLAFLIPLWRCEWALQEDEAENIKTIDLSEQEEDMLREKSEVTKMKTGKTYGKNIKTMVYMNKYKDEYGKEHETKIEVYENAGIHLEKRTEDGKTFVYVNNSAVEHVFREILWAMERNSGDGHVYITSNEDKRAVRRVEGKVSKENEDIESPQRKTTEANRSKNGTDPKKKHTNKRTAPPQKESKQKDTFNNNNEQEGIESGAIRREFILIPTTIYFLVFLINFI